MIYADDSFITVVFNDIPVTPDLIHNRIAYTGDTLSLEVIKSKRANRVLCF